MKKDIDFILKCYASTAKSIEKKAILPLLLYYIQAKGINLIFRSILDAGKGYLKTLDDVISDMESIVNKKIEPNYTANMSNYLNTLKSARSKLSFEGIKFENASEKDIQMSFYKLNRAKKTVDLINQTFDKIIETRTKVDSSIHTDESSIINKTINEAYRAIPYFGTFIATLSKRIETARTQSKEFVAQIDNLTNKLREALAEIKLKQTEGNKDEEDLRQETADFMKSV